MSNYKTFISRDYFYKSHQNEISKYINQDTEYINIFNKNSKFPKEYFNNVLVEGEDKTLEVQLKETLEKRKMDLIILSDIFELTDDVYNTLKNVKSFLKDEGLLILSSTNPLWYLLINFIEKIGLKEPSKFKAYIKPNKVENILKAANYQKVKNYNRLYIPFKLFGLGPMINYLIYLLLPFLNLGIRNYLIYTNKNFENKKISKSIIVPAKNEEGNLEELLDRIPHFDNDYEIIIVCGKSNDNTLEKAKSLINSRPKNIIKVLNQSKNGKANAVWEGLELCNKDLIAILDSDLSVDPEKLVDFFEIIENGHADFVNGTRLIYKMEKGAMQSLNKLGNRFFQFIISKLISVKLTDSLCGTKVFKKENIENIKKWQDSMKFEDPFCDFDLIFSAAYSSQKIVELPVYYRSRKYGTTNISRFKDGWKLLFYFFNSYILFKTDFKKKEI
tara:strand:+ start:306 stop:1640 length:1335 start_codon:yes stop_codon:yes gene_type:complete